MTDWLLWSLSDNSLHKVSKQEYSYTERQTYANLKNKERLIFSASMKFIFS
jgi:hypothetical protein